MSRFRFGQHYIALHEGCHIPVPLPFVECDLSSFLGERAFVSSRQNLPAGIFRLLPAALPGVHEGAQYGGAGTLFVTGRSGSGNPYGDVEFTALNTNYTGRIKVCAEVNNVTAGADDYKHERVFITDARNLGGPLDAFKADALELADYSVLEARKDVDMNVANRGITVTGNAAFAAPENVTLAISNDITWNGAVRKTGDGTLALNGAARVASGATATLAVEKGCLRVGSTNALSGVSVTFADGAALLVDPAATSRRWARSIFRMRLSAGRSPWRSSCLRMASQITSTSPSAR